MIDRGQHGDLICRSAARHLRRLLALLDPGFQFFGDPSDSRGPGRPSATSFK